MTTPILTGRKECNPTLFPAWKMEARSKCTPTLNLAYACLQFKSVGVHYFCQLEWTWSSNSITLSTPMLAYVYYHYSWELCPASWADCHGNLWHCPRLDHEKEGQSLLCQEMGDFIPSQYSYWCIYISEPGFHPVMENHNYPPPSPGDETKRNKHLIFCFCFINIPGTL